MSRARRAKQYIVLIATIAFYDRSDGDPPVDVCRGGGAAPAFHPGRRGASPRAVRAVAPDPAARARAGHTAVRAHEPPRHGDRGGRGDRRASPPRLRRAGRRPRRGGRAARHPAGADAGSVRSCRPATSTSPGLLARFGQAHPGVEISLREGIADDMFRFLAADELDAAFCLLSGDVPEHLAGHPLGQVEIIAAFAADRAPAGRHVSVADLEQSPDRRDAPRLGHHHRPRTAVRRGGRATAPGSRERRPVAAAIAGRAGLRHRAPAAIVHRRGGRRSRGTTPGAAPSCCRWRCSGGAHATCRRPRGRSSSSSGATTTAEAGTAVPGDGPRR